MNNKLFKLFTGFFILFILYHAAEYMIVFHNSSWGFLSFQFLFFIAAWLIAKWQTGKGLSAWGLDCRLSVAEHLLPGIAMGVLLYALYYFISLACGSEEIVDIPNSFETVFSFLVFCFGCIFSSLSEDILTRGYVWHHLKNKTGSLLLVIISATIFLLNHIYKFTEGPERMIYIFLLGMLFFIPLVLTKRLWFTAGMHWAGNSFFYFTHGVLTTDVVANHLSPNYILAICSIIMIPVNYFVFRIFKLIPPKDLRSAAAG